MSVLLHLCSLPSLQRCSCLLQAFSRLKRFCVDRWQPYAAKCTVCKSALHQQAIYCQSCAYSKGVCAMCGKQILDTTGYKQSHA